MEKIKHFIEEHPYAIVGGLAAVVLLWVVLRGGSPATATTVSGTTGLDPVAAQLQAAQLSASAGVHASDNSLTSQLAQIAASITNTRTSTDATVAINNANDTTQQALAALGASVSTSGITAQRDINIAGINAQTTLAGIQSDTTKSLASINAGVLNNANNNNVALGFLNASTGINNNNAILNAISVSKGGGLVAPLISDTGAPPVTVYTATANLSGDINTFAADMSGSNLAKVGADIRIAQATPGIDMTALQKVITNYQAFGGTL